MAAIVSLPDTAGAPVSALEQVVADALLALFATRDPTSTDRPRVAVAFSGGADSAALLHIAAALQRRGVVDVVALHVHHGLADAADAWLVHCRDQAGGYGIAFDAAHVAPTRQGGSLEAEARRLRYAALTGLCDRHRCTVLMTAHHADDQAETVLVNLARGAGIGGLSAAARARPLDGVTLFRPLLDVSAATLREHVELHEISYVVDPSNADRRFTRNAIRHEVMPALRRIAPTIATRLAQTAAHASSMQSLLDEIGVEDLARGKEDEGNGADGAAGPHGDRLDVDRLAALSGARAANALRVWLAQRGLRAPSAAALREMLDQLLHASPDAQIALLHERQTLRLYRGRVSIDRGGPARASFTSLTWDGEDRIDVPDWNGALHFTAAADDGFDAAALRAGPLALRERRGGERMRERVDGPSRTLKNLYQEAGIAAWQRRRLPLVYLGERLLLAAGLGPNAAAMLDTAGVDAAPRTDLIRLAWTSNDPSVGDRPSTTDGS